MVSAAHFIIQRAGLTLACREPKGSPAPWDWRFVDPRKTAPPADMLTWETRDGAQKFADMNGGIVTTVMEYFYSPRQDAGTN